MSIFLNTPYFRLIGRFQWRHQSQSVTSKLLSNNHKMPKDPKHIPEAQKQRKKIKERYSKYVPGKVTLHVLGSGANGAPRSLYVFSDQSRYMFNCGEGTQRLAHEHKMKLAKLEHIFITQNVWKNMGGLPGTALTIQDVGVPKITLHGPKGLDELFRATKRFVIMKNLKLEMAECNESTTFEDNVMTVKYVPLERKHIEKTLEESIEPECNKGNELDKDIQVGTSTSIMTDVSTTTRSSRKRRRSKSSNRSKSRSDSASSSISEDDTYYHGQESKKMRHNARNRSRSHSAAGMSSHITPENKQALIETKETGIVMSYICRLTSRPGTLNLDKCVKCGVPPGPLLGLLKNGQDVTLENGNVVKHTDVCEPDDPGPVFIVVDCPTEEYLDSLINNKSFIKHQANGTKDDDLAYLIVHFTPNHIMTNLKYKMWMEKFSPSTQHIVINESNKCMGSISVHRIQHQLNLLNPDFFPLLEDEMSPYEENGLSSLNVIQPKTFGSFHLRPKKGYDNISELTLAPEDYIAESLAVTGFKTELEKLKPNLEQKKKTLGTNAYPKILFLGTGSCIPNKTRNTSGILLQTSDKTNIIVDCGEGTYGQIVRFFGQNNSKRILAETDAVYVSHLHADHHIGLIGFLQGRRRARNALGLQQKPVYLLAPKQILTWLHFYDLCFEDISDEYELILNGDLILGKRVLDAAEQLTLFESLNMNDISTCLVKHCPNAFGVAFTHKLGFKITYSGDTMPSENLIELGMNSDLLIHEATMEDELANEAIIKMHSTTSQAISVGERMKAKYIILTHFSQRYAKLPRFNDNFTENIGIAFDNMQMRLDELPLVPLLYPALKVMFAEHYEELENKAVKRQLRQERKAEASPNRSKSPLGPKITT